MAEVSTEINCSSNSDCLSWHENSICGEDNNCFFFYPTSCPHPCVIGD